MITYREFVGATFGETSCLVDKLRRGGGIFSTNCFRLTTRAADRPYAPSSTTTIAWSSSFGATAPFVAPWAAADAYVRQRLEI